MFDILVWFSLFKCFYPANLSRMLYAARAIEDLSWTPLTLIWRIHPTKLCVCICPGWSRTGLTVLSAPKVMLTFTTSSVLYKKKRGHWDGCENVFSQKGQNGMMAMFRVTFLKYQMFVKNNIHCSQHLCSCPHWERPSVKYIDIRTYWYWFVWQ